LSQKHLSTSTTVGFAARPLTLFYALSQAVRGIAAAAVSEPDWQPRAHGATQRDGESVVSASIEVKQIGSLPLLSAALNAPRLTGSIRLAAAWSALPNLAKLPIDRAMPCALGVQLSEMDADVAGRARVWVSNLPYHLRNASVEDLTRELEHYPTPLGCGRPALLNDKSKLYWGFEDTLAVDWPVERVPESGPNDTSTRIRNIRAIYEGFERIALRQPDGSRWLIPSIDDDEHIPHPLQAWWLVLFSLSTFARYQPAEWREALDVDRSQVAVSLEHALDVALTALPELIFQALVALVK
jgi:hypothetical protein